MGPYTQALDLEPDPVALARRFERLPGSCLLWTADGTGASYLACSPTCTAQGLDPEPELPLRAREEPGWSYPRWIGVLPYEALRSLEAPPAGPVDARPAPHLSEPLWFRYDAVLRVDSEVVVLAETRQALARLVGVLSTAPRPSAALELTLRETEAPEHHFARIEAARRRILDGDVYVVNLARRFGFEFRGDPLDLLQQLGRTTRPRYGAFLQLPGTSVVGTSPELFLSLAVDRSVLTEPIKGTLPRDTDPIRDEQLRRQLADDPKESAELAMVVDVERNDLARVSQVGSVRLCGPAQVRDCGTVWHRVAQVQGRLASTHGRGELLASMAPSGSVTGAPKVSAMRIIAELESQRRGLYTGALGYLTHQGELQLAMAIRTLTCRGQQLHYHTGGGIVVDSNPSHEVEETQWKARQLLELCRERG